MAKKQAVPSHQTTAGSEPARLEEPTTSVANQNPTLLVAVRPDCRWHMITAAGQHWTKTPVRINRNMPILDELRNNPHLLVTEE